MNTVKNGKGSEWRKGTNFKLLRKNYDDIKWPSLKKKKKPAKT